MIKFLAEDLTYKVYSLDESVYLKRKAHSKQHADYEARDLCIAAHYGDPTSALILSEHIIVAGCGLSIFTLATRAEIHLFAEPAAIRWTNGLHQDDLDSNSEFRFITYSTETPQLCKMNVLTHEVTVLA